MSDNTNELKTCAPGCFGLKASTPGSTMEARLLGHEDAVPAVPSIYSSFSESTVSRYLPRRPAEPDQLKRWMAFLRNHKDDIAAMDLFTVPTASLRLLYGFFVIEHGRRHIVHFNATFHPTSAWVI